MDVRHLEGVDDARALPRINALAWRAVSDESLKPVVGENETGLNESYVEPNCRGDGIGTTLLERGLALLLESVERVRLETLDGNEVSHRFYSSREFDWTVESELEIAGEAYPPAIFTLER